MQRGEYNIDSGLMQGKSGRKTLAIFLKKNIINIGLDVTANFNLRLFERRVGY